jgi:hypothetical protein
VSNNQLDFFPELTPVKGHIFLIGENHVLCVNSEIEIYRIPPLSCLEIGLGPAVEDRDGQDILQPVWHYPGHRLNVIPSFSFDGTAYRLVIQDDNGVVGISIPSSLENEPCVMFRLQTAFPRPIARAVGLYKGCTMFDDMHNVRFGYRWRSDAGAHFVQGEDNPRGSVRRLTFDEETGCCISEQSWGCLRVVDFLSRA